MKLILKNFLKRIFPALLIANLLITTSCQEESATTDNDQRVVTLGVAIAEIVHDLDCGINVVAIDDSTTTVEAYSELPSVGYYRAFSAEGVLAQQPTLILISDKAGPPAAVEQLQASGVEVAVISEEEGLSAIPEKIRTVAQIVGCEDKADALIAEVEEDISREVATGSEPKRVLFLMSPPGSGMWLASGKNTTADQVIKAASGVNIITEFEGYKPFSREAFAVLDPDLIVAPGSALQISGGVDEVLNQLGFSPDSPARQAGVYEIDIAEFLSTGPRIGRSISGLKKELHAAPDADASADSQP